MKFYQKICNRNFPYCEKAYVTANSNVLHYLYVVYQITQIIFPNKQLHLNRICCLFLLEREMKQMRGTNIICMHRFIINLQYLLVVCCI